MSNPPRPSGSPVTKRLPRVIARNALRSSTKLGPLGVERARGALELGGRHQPIEGIVLAHRGHQRPGEIEAHLPVHARRPAGRLVDEGPVSD